ncbi:aromatic-ring-hydroxylating dioxygenase subunit beta [Mycobacterium sp. 050128]|uniref:aromatic-ring-hydroxylating dioxygenase subunit beta n=1 Tax=Mycobacterium TaxID=1763 RepID=UPI0004486092|nr:aromatic-ring-hydroxylating dioxygenase subunit beta [Mycobacterium intracellulare]ASL18804.1 aromatic-ring-hydroxylating dioxygenase subunit beta [Mycobacterium intracellulare subsp. chimaera]ETZ37638.1 ring hydroxylating beta subunit [Mycobacterium intracellulare MIN_052511_1280]MDM3909664.1 aromatic-ring-hydroxylating dioxygenase subunit beta [Mycobacterium intracellulare subsp. chimaera]UCN04385.1 aromatic-ring-hydroxylating dioxygenase subunit beta [Mycobacterium intracellulare subsp. c
MLDLDLRLRVNEFYARETMLLDDGLMAEWLQTMVAKDVRYVMPFPESSTHPDTRDEGLPPFFLFNDDYESLNLRIARLATGLAPGETPRTITQRIVSDILVTDGDDREVGVRSSVMVFLVRHERHENLFAGKRQDVLRRDEHGGLQLAARVITLAHSVLPRAISIFF